MAYEFNLNKTYDDPELNELAVRLKEQLTTTYEYNRTGTPVANAIGMPLVFIALIIATGGWIFPLVESIQYGLWWTWLVWLMCIPVPLIPLVIEDSIPKYKLSYAYGELQRTCDDLPHITVKKFTDLNPVILNDIEFLLKKSREERKQFLLSKRETVKRLQHLGLKDRPLLSDKEHEGKLSLVPAKDETLTKQHLANAQREVDQLLSKG